MFYSIVFKYTLAFLDKDLDISLPNVHIIKLINVSDYPYNGIP